MASVADLVEPVALRDRAGEYLAHAGEVLRAAGAVRLVELGPIRVAATVEDGPTRAVVLEARGAVLATSCDCGAPNADGLCPHIVAAALETWERAPDRRA
jgi:uncharacterized Zn finger protein